MFEIAPAQLALLKLVVQKSVNLDVVSRVSFSHTSTALWVAAFSMIPVEGEGDGALALATLIVDKGADVNIAGGACDDNLESAPLWLVAKAIWWQGAAGKLVLAKLLIDKGADVDAVGRDEDSNVCAPLWWAAKAVYDDWAPVHGLALAKLLIDNGAGVNPPGAVGLVGNWNDVPQFLPPSPGRVVQAEYT